MKRKVYITRDSTTTGIRFMEVDVLDGEFEGYVRYKLPTQPYIITREWCFTREEAETTFRVQVQKQLDTAVRRYQDLLKRGPIFIEEKK
jgi:hypothetical protein